MKKVGTCSTPVRSYGAELPIAENIVHRYPRGCGNGQAKFTQAHDVGFVVANLVICCSSPSTEQSSNLCFAKPRTGSFDRKLSPGSQKATVSMCNYPKTPREANGCMHDANQQVLHTKNEKQENQLACTLFTGDIVTGAHECSRHTPCCGCARLVHA